MDDQKSIHTLILDAGPLIKNVPSVSTLIAKGQTLLTIPSILSEIRDAPTRARLETTLKPFLTVRNPKPESIKVVQEFARKSGDLQVLSRPDLLILALAYEVECERNGGDWRLRKVPGQKGLNGSPPKREEIGGDEAEKKVDGAERKEEAELTAEVMAAYRDQGDKESKQSNVAGKEMSSAGDGNAISEPVSSQELSNELANTHISTNAPVEQISTDTSEAHISSEESHAQEDTAGNSQDSDSDSEGWITPSNIAKHQLKASTPAISSTSAPPKTLQVATLTTDFAMQNVLLLMNLNLLSQSLTRISYLRTYILRCHACFLQIKDLSKQFCPRCGQPSLTRVSCSTDARTGEFTLHLKANMQWNRRGERFSIPKPVVGSSSGRRDIGGGKGGWGKELILAEDQKEYMRAMSGIGRKKERDLMDEDFLPAILSGERKTGGGRPRVGAGRNVNSRKR